MKKKIRFDYVHFWPKFKSEGLITRFPILSTKYEFIYDPIKPDYLFFSAFDGSMGERMTMPTPPDLGIPTVFLTAENVVPDLTRCDYAISFTYGLDEKRHIRIPNWVQRLNQIGLSPKSLLIQNRRNDEKRSKFCAYIFRNRVALREKMFSALNQFSNVDAPSISMNNMPPIGRTPKEKLNFLASYRFNISFENSCASGYTTEKLPESLIAGAIPIYWGDPDVALDFNKEAFLDLSNFSSIDELCEEVMRIESDCGAYFRIKSEPTYNNNQLPDCADDNRILSFFEGVLG